MGTEGPERRGIYSLTQVSVIIALVAALGAGVYFIKHRNLSKASIISSGQADHEFRPDINAATWEELALLPGIGETKAKAIVDYRKTGGRFRSAEDLENVRGIGKKTAATIAQHVRFPDRQEEASQ